MSDGDVGGNTNLAVDKADSRVMMPMFVNENDSAASNDISSLQTAGVGSNTGFGGLATAVRRHTAKDVRRLIHQDTQQVTDRTQ